MRFSNVSTRKSDAIRIFHTADVFLKFEVFFERTKGNTVKNVISKPLHSAKLKFSKLVLSFLLLHVKKDRDFRECDKKIFKILEEEVHLYINKIGVCVELERKWKVGIKVENWKEFFWLKLNFFPLIKITILAVIQTPKEQKNTEIWKKNK